MIPVEFKNTPSKPPPSVRTATAILRIEFNWSELYSGVSSEQPTALVPYVCLHYYVIRLTSIRKLLENFTSTSLQTPLRKN